MTRQQSTGPFIKVRVTCKKPPDSFQNKLADSFSVCIPRYEADGPGLEENLALIQTIVGEKSRAIDALP